MMKYLYTLLTLLFTITITGILPAQTPPRIPLPDGESVVRTVLIRTGGAAPVTRRYIATAHYTYSSDYTAATGTWSAAVRQDALPDPGYRFYADAGVVFGDFLALTGNGAVYRCPVSQSDGRLLAPISTTTIPAQPGEAFRRLIPGAPHIITTQRVLSSQDTGRTWTANTAGLSGAIPADAGITATGTTYLATNNGLYRQTVQGSPWQIVTAAPSGNYQSVYIDRRQRIHAAAGALAYLSDDGGSSWSLDTAGLGGHSVRGFADNLQGDLYAYASDPDDALYRKTGGSGQWQQKGQNFTTPSYGANGQAVFNNITADSVVLLSTLFGSFSSSDRGDTWTEANKGVQAQAAYGFVKSRDGRMSVSTITGVYTRGAGSTEWVRMFPRAGYLGGQPLLHDTGYVLYTFGARTGSGDKNTLREIIISHDGGSTWRPDTAGISGVRDGRYTIDLFGTQHITPYMPDGGPLHYSKMALDTVWKADTAGIRAPNRNAYLTAIGTNRGGLVFTCMDDSGRGTIWRKPGAAPTWGQDTSKYGGAVLTIVQPYIGGGGLVAGTTDSGLIRRVNSNWVFMPCPTAEYSTLRVPALTVDLSSVAYAAFSAGDGNGGSTPRGVYYTMNFGANWTDVHLDSVHTTQLVSFDDTTYALTLNGLYVLTHPPKTAVPEESGSTPRAGNVTLHAMQRADGTMEITVSTVTGGLISLQITDAAGRRIGAMKHVQAYPGNQMQIQYNPGQIPVGMYYVHATDGRSAAVTPLLWTR